MATIRPPRRRVSVSSRHVSSEISHHSRCMTCSLSRSTEIGRNVPMPTCSVTNDRSIPRSAARGQKFWREMKSGRGGRHRARTPRVCRLVALPVRLRATFSPNVREASGTVPNRRRTSIAGSSVDGLAVQTPSASRSMSVSVSRSAVRHACRTVCRHDGDRVARLESSARLADQPPLARRKRLEK